MKLKTLPSRLVSARRHALAAPSRVEATPRLRGRKWMERRAAWLRSHPLCRHCAETGRTEIATEVDHIEPLWRGGVDDERNYQSLCGPCHAVKTAEEAKERGGSSLWAG